MIVRARGRELAVIVGILVTATALIVGGYWMAAARSADDWPARVYRVCEQYAGLDLSGLAPLCADAGYQQRVYVQPTGAPAYWPPPAVRTLQPEDLDAPG